MYSRPVGSRHCSRNRCREAGRSSSSLSRIELKADIETMLLSSVHPSIHSSTHPSIHPPIHPFIIVGIISCMANLCRCNYLDRECTRSDTRHNCRVGNTVGSSARGIGLNESNHPLILDVLTMNEWMKNWMNGCASNQCSWGTNRSCIPACRPSICLECRRNSSFERYTELSTTTTT